MKKIERKWREREKARWWRRDENDDTVVLRLYPLLDLLVAFAIGWLTLAIREADTSVGDGGWSSTGSMAQVRQKRYDETAG